MFWVLDLFGNSVSCRTSLAFFGLKPWKMLFFNGSCSETEVSEQLYWLPWSFGFSFRRLWRRAFGSLQQQNGNRLYHYTRQRVLTKCKAFHTCHFTCWFYTSVVIKILCYLHCFLGNSCKGTIFFDGLSKDPILPAHSDIQGEILASRRSMLHSSSADRLCLRRRIRDSRTCHSMSPCILRWNRKTAWNGG
jgi:hypothetical protein